MSEINQVFLGFLSILSSVVYSLFYAIGGRDVDFLGVRARIWKRVIAPTWLSLSVIGISFLAKNFDSLIVFALIPLFVPIGYGGDYFMEKFKRRAIYSAVMCLPTVFLAILNDNYLIAIAQISLGMYLTLFLGLLNPLDAPLEEGVIALANTIFIGFTLL